MFIEIYNLSGIDIYIAFLNMSGKNIVIIVSVLVLSVLIAGFYMEKHGQQQGYHDLPYESFAMSQGDITGSLHTLLINYVTYLHNYMFTVIGKPSLITSNDPALVSLISILNSNQMQIAQVFNSLYPNMYATLEPLFIGQATIFQKLVVANIKRNVRDIDTFTNDLANNTKFITIALHDTNLKFDFEHINALMSQVTIALNKDMGVIISGAPDAVALADAQQQAIILADYIIKQK